MLWAAELALGALGLVGHIHVAKTGGSTLNQILANGYHGVCGHKGYSFDYYQANVRGKGKIKPGQVEDSVYKQYPGYDRTRVPLPLMFERGFEACRWVSFESDMNTWNDLAPLLTELHLPCRDPVDHFMSQMNHKAQRIDCDTFVPSTANQLLLGVSNRFRDDTKLKVRCMHFSNQFISYPAALGLPKKRISQPLHILPTNRKRNKHNECIWNNTDLKARLHNHLVATVDYYRFCDRCTDWIV